MNLKEALEYFSVKSIENYSLADLRTDYKKLAKQYHPDTNNGNHKAFVKLRQAYHIIADGLNNINSQKVENKTFKTRPKNSYSPSTNITDSSSLQIQLQILYGETQNTSIETKEKFQQLWSDFSEKRAKIINIMEHDLDKLKNKPSLLRFIFFWKSETITERNLNYQIKLNEYQQKLYDLDTSYLKQVVKMYSDALNHLNHIVTDQVES